MSKSTRTSRKILERSSNALFSIFLLAPLAMAPKGCDSAIIGTDCPEGLICTPGASGAAGSVAGGKAGASGAGNAGAGNASASGAGNASASGAGNASASGAGNAPNGNPGCELDQECNDLPTVSSLWGHCQPDGTCSCNPGRELNPATGKCRLSGSGAGGAGSSSTCGGLLGLSCEGGEYCAFSIAAACGAADQTGTCKPLAEICTDIYKPVCGCDGKTYANDCYAAREGVSVAKPGECAPATPQCGGLQGLSCAKGEFCSFAPEALCGAADQTGSCKPRPDVCNDIYQPVCGCDDKTYGNECEAEGAGVSVAKKGACAPTTRACGGLLGLTCGKGEFCSFAPDAICGAADQTGTCKLIPDACDLIYAPVCGCDGKTYSNDCVAEQSGVSVAKKGECATAASECGGLLGKACPKGQFCLFPPDQACGNADMIGQCTVPPEVCTLEIDYVCGCDGKTYSNSCAAARAGVSVLAKGKCK